MIRALNHDQLAVSEEVCIGLFPDAEDGSLFDNTMTSLPQYDDVTTPNYDPGAYQIQVKSLLQSISDFLDKPALVHFLALSDNDLSELLHVLLGSTSTKTSSCTNGLMSTKTNSSMVLNRGA